MKKDITNILITGGSGYIGNHIEDIKYKKYNLIFFVNKKKIINSSKKILVNKKNIFNKIKKIDYIIHLAGSDNFYKNKNIRENNKSLDRFIKKLVYIYKVKKLIFTSSNKVYEDSKEEFIFENTIPRFSSIYAKSKFASEKILKRLPCKTIILRLPSVISRDFSKGLIYRILSKLEKNKKIVIFNPDSLFNNIINAGELIKVIFMSLNLKKSLTINLAANKPIKIIQVLNYLKKQTNSKSEIHVVNRRNNTKFYSTNLQNRIFKSQISSVKTSLNKLFKN